ncbi:MAG: energy-coupling factor ABC transporter ATP-binding protein [Spirochaetes bacterium]|nr:energy-coupling factor ABC transporter ATP-binding protein [Spirochaetota bacterium]
MPEEPAPAVALHNITKRFALSQDALAQTDPGRQDGRFFTALDDVSFSLASGGCTLICGANGSGKSLLMAIIAGLEEPTSGSAQTAFLTGLIFQDPDSQILGETPSEDIAFGPANLGLSKEEIEKRVAAALEETGLTERAHYPARSLSGGEKRRLAVAGVLAMDAQIIIFDEPYANMDYHGVVQVNWIIKKLLGAGKTVIILTHELEKCLALADRVIVLFKGRITFDGSALCALQQELEAWGIRNPLRKPALELGDLLWQ